MGLSERQFVNLPEFWSGFGVFANYTYTDSSRDISLQRFGGAGDIETVRFEDVAFNRSSPHSGTAALTYSKYGFDANLVYSWQDRRLQRFEANGLSVYDEAFDTLDFRAEYLTDRFGPQLRFYLEGNDLLRSEGEAVISTTVGGTGPTPKYYTGGRYFGGRSITLGMAATF